MTKGEDADLKVLVKVNGLPNLVLEKIYGEGALFSKAFDCAAKPGHRFFGSQSFICQRTDPNNGMNLTIRFEGGWSRSVFWPAHVERNTQYDDIVGTWYNQGWGVDPDPLTSVVLAPHIYIGDDGIPVLNNGYYKGFPANEAKLVPNTDGRTYSAQFGDPPGGKGKGFTNITVENDPKYGGIYIDFNNCQDVWFRTAWNAERKLARDTEFKARMKGCQ